MIEGVFIGALQVELHLPGARTIKDRRATAVGLRDRLRSRLGLAVHEVDRAGAPTRAVLIAVTAGNDPTVIRSVLDQARHICSQVADGVVVHLDVEVFPWQGRGVRGLPGIHGDGDG